MSVARAASSLLCSTIAVLASAQVSQAQYVPVRDLDPGGIVDFDFPIKTVDGLAVGQGLVPGGFAFQPILWDLAGAHFLPMPTGTTEGYAYDLDEAGTIVGNVIDWFNGRFLAVSWSNGVITDLNTLLDPGSKWTLIEARDIDEDGRIACTGYDAAGTHALLLDHGGLTDLGALTKSDSWAMVMNEDAVVAGQCIFQTPPNEVHGCVFRNGQVLDLHDPSFMTGGFDATWDIDRFDRVVGNYDVAGAGLDQRAFFWDGTVSVDLAPYFPAGTSTAMGIDDFGQIVGSYTTASGTASAFLWRNGVVTDLNTLIDPSSGWVLTDATGIDDDGRIIGRGSLNGVSTAFILEPICNGTFTLYGTDCAGSGGIAPTLNGAGCPTPDRPFALEVRDGLANTMGFLFAGIGTGSLQVKPGCDLQVMPLAFAPVPIVLDGRGRWWNEADLPIGTPILDLNLQALFFDAGAAHGISGTKPLALHFE